MAKYVLVRHTVSYFPGWKEVFDNHQKKAHEYNMRTVNVMRDLTNPNDMTILFEADDLDKAKKFMTSHVLQEAMKKGGVIRKPDIFYLSGVS